MRTRHAGHASASPSNVLPTSCADPCLVRCSHPPRGYSTPPPSTTKDISVFASAKHRNQWLPIVLILRSARYLKGPSFQHLQSRARLLCLMKASPDARISPKSCDIFHVSTHNKLWQQLMALPCTCTHPISPQKLTLSAFTPSPLLAVLLAATRRAFPLSCSSRLQRPLPRVYSSLGLSVCSPFRDPAREQDPHRPCCARCLASTLPSR